MACRASHRLPYRGDVSNWSQVSRSDVLAAMAECDRLGSREFLGRYRFGRSKASTVWHGGHEYDSKALLGVALLHASGRPATKDDFRDGEGAATRLLTGMGFDVVVDQDQIELEDRAAADRALSGETATPAPPVEDDPQACGDEEARRSQDGEEGCTARSDG